MASKLITRQVGQNITISITKGDTLAHPLTPLPIRFRPRVKVCELENNPQFTLEVDHQTDMKISLIQVKARAIIDNFTNRPKRHCVLCASATFMATDLEQALTTQWPFRRRETLAYIPKAV